MTAAPFLVTALGDRVSTARHRSRGYLAIAATAAHHESYRIGVDPVLEHIRLAYLATTFDDVGRKHIGPKILPVFGVEPAIGT